MRSSRIALLIGVLMCAASLSAMWLQPSTKIADVAPFSLDRMIPRQFGDWQVEEQQQVQVINPETKALLNKLYSQIVNRVYVNSESYRIMLSVAYGTDQRGALQAHKPEVCYPAQGFTLIRNEAAQVATRFGGIAARRLFTTMGPREEPVTYWFTSGDNVVRNKLQKRLMDLRYGLTGLIPDGVIFRVSSIDGDQGNANQHQDEFVNQLLEAVSAEDRKRLSGLSGAPR
jgi:EpsI family protein